MNICSVYIGAYYYGKHFIIKIKDGIRINNMILNNDNITGMQQIYKAGCENSKVIIEVKNKVIDIDKKYKIFYPSENYIVLIMNHNTMTNIFGNYKKESLPNWVKNIPMLNTKYRKIIQRIILFIEICLCLWTLYQIIFNTPSLKIFFGIFRPILSYLFYPITYLWKYVGDYFNFVFYIQILSNFGNTMLYPLFLLYSFIFEIIYPFINLIKVIFYIVKTLFYIPYCLLLVITKLFNFRVYNQSKNIIKTIPLYIRFINGIKYTCIYTWNILIKPIKHLYVLYNTPKSGELGRILKENKNK